MCKAMKTKEERLKIKQAKKQHKAALSNKVIYNERRDAIIYQILNSQTPKWGSLKL